MRRRPALYSALALLSLPVFRQHGQGDTTSTQAVLRGLCGRCPNCGRGHMFTSFLKVADYCPACGEELFHQRADDFPAYLDILLVGHTVVPLALLVETEYAPAMWLQLAAWCRSRSAFRLASYSRSRARSSPCSGLAACMDLRARAPGVTDLRQHGRTIQSRPPIREARARGRG